ncbi:MAG: hypothetical protein PWP41_1861 [Moorella sp. (in: firmicutes)]|nr:hypothetical protein [Moorella sp. (in: firmicutes)]
MVSCVESGIIRMTGTNGSGVEDLAEIRGINRTNDYAFKRIFGSEEGKEALLGFLNAVLKLPPGQELAHVELLDREIDPQYLLDRGARLDVLARTEEGTLLNIEVQVANQYNIDKRTMYYWAILYQGQLTSGQKFADLKMIERQPANSLEAWMMYLNNLEGEAMEAIAMENPGIRKALTIEQAFWQSKKERRLYELREKAIRDEISALAGARAEGEARGEARGRQEAICKYLEVRFGEASWDLQGRVRQIGRLEALDKIINKIYTTGSLEEAQDVIDDISK